MKLNNTPQPLASLTNVSNKTRFESPKFSGAEALATKYTAPQIRKFTKAADFRNLGETTVNMIKLMYGMVIASRIVAAGTRSWNEMREAATRDIMGYSFWLFLVPILQRATILLGQKDTDYKNALLRKTAQPTGEGLKASIKKLMWHNPTVKYQITSSQEIKDWTAQTMKYLERQGHSKDSEAVQKATQYFEKLLAKRRVVTGVGFAITIGVIGIGINLFNMYMTEKAVKAGKVGKY